MGRFEEIPDEPAAAPVAAASRYEEIDETAPKADARGHEIDPRFADEAPVEKALKNTGSYDEVMANFRGDKAAAQAASDAAITPQEGEGFFKRAFKSAAHGVRAVGVIGGDVIGSRGKALLDPQKRRQLGRGIDDIVTLGYGQKLAARVGNAAGDQPDVALGPETFRGLFSSAGAPVANTQAADQEAAPEYRTGGQFVGGFVPGAGQLLGKAAGKLVGRAVPAAAGLIPEAAAGVVKGVAGYEAAAPIAAGLSANAEGNRLEAAKQAATDPLGLLMAGAGGGAGEAFQKRTLASKGAKARALIEAEGQGATVSPLSAGEGGVFDRELKGVPANDRGIGAAAKIGARGIADTIEQQFKDEHGFDYREGPAVLKGAAVTAKEQAQIARRAARAADIAYRDDISAAKDAVKTETAARAKQIIDQIEEEHRTETSRPYRKLKAEIDSSPEASAPRDVAPIVKSMQDAVNDLETAPHVRGALNEQLKILENYRTKQFDPDALVQGGGLDGMKAGEAVALLEKQRHANPAIGEEIDRIKSDATSPDGPIMVPERQLNGLRRTLMRSAKVGSTDAPGEAEAPLRRAAFVAKQMVDEGPYKALNDLYAEGASKREAARKAVGLKGKPAKEAAADERRLTSNLRNLVADETAIPGPLPPEADMAPVRAALKAPLARRESAMSRIRADLAIAEKNRAGTVSKVTEATKAAEADRALLGLNTKIGTRKTDVNQIRLALQRQGENSGTAGGSAGATDVLSEFVAKHPETRPLTMLPELQRAKSDLSFHVTPGHGGAMHKGVGEALGPAALAYTAFMHPVATLGALAAVNRAPIAGRFLTPLARKVNAPGIGGRLGALTGAGPSPDDVALAREIQKLVAMGMPLNDAILAARGTVKSARGDDAGEAAPSLP